MQRGCKLTQRGCKRAPGRRAARSGGSRGQQPPAPRQPLGCLRRGGLETKKPAGFVIVFQANHINHHPYAIPHSPVVIMWNAEWLRFTLCIPSCSLDHVSCALAPADDGLSHCWSTFVFVCLFVFPFRRLHRLLLLTTARHQCRDHVPGQGERADAQLVGHTGGSLGHLVLHNLLSVYVHF